MVGKFSLFCHVQHTQPSALPLGSLSFLTAICAARRILQYAPAAPKEEEDQKEINPVGTLAGNATFATPLKNAGERKMRRKNWMTSRTENMGSSLDEEKETVDGAGAEAEEVSAEATEAEGVRKTNGEAIVKELSEAGEAPPPPDGSVNGDEGYAEDEVDNVEEGRDQNGEENTGTAVFHFQFARKNHLDGDSTRKYF